MMNKQELLDFFKYLDRRGFLRDDLQCDPEHQVESYIAMRQDDENHFVEANEMISLKPQYIDLGLPSGTLWATCNVGAKKPEKYGDYFTWSEAMELDCTLPTKEQIEELIKECNSIWTEQNGVNGCLFTGPNGNTMFLPAAGDHLGKSLYCCSDIYGGYWSSTLNDGNPNQAYYLSIDSEYVGLLYYCSVRVCGKPVRAVKSK